jgi:hypothetical protein
VASGSIIEMYFLHVKQGGQIYNRETLKEKGIPVHGREAEYNASNPGYNRRSPGGWHVWGGGGELNRLNEVSTRIELI